MSVISIPISMEDNYILQTLTKEKNIKSINRYIRGITIPVGIFNIGLHEQVTLGIDPDNKKEISYYANYYKHKIEKVNATALEIYYCVIDDKIKVSVDWDDDEDVPEELRITAAVKGKRCIRIMQFGCEF